MHQPCDIVNRYTIKTYKMKTLSIMSTTLFAVLSVLMYSCSKDQTPPVIELTAECPEVISFANQIEPIIQNNCSTSGCHDATSSGGYNLQGYSNISSNATAILSAMRHETPTPMPVGAPQLADSLIQQFACWTSQGTINN